MELILASRSPRRQELLQLITPNFSVDPAQGEERLEPGLSPEAAVQALALGKAREVAQRHPGCLILGADTVVCIDGQILGKPKDPADCRAMLQRLSGRVHQVHTGVAILAPGVEKVFAESTQVAFYPLDQRAIDWYSSLEEPYDKAGSYGIQGRGSLLVQGIQGDYFNVVGLPVAAVARALGPYLSQE